jgi:O-antigen/teichoic acid export membrane protein
MTRSISLHYAERVRADEQIAIYSILQIAGPVLGFALGMVFMYMFEASVRAVIGGFWLAQSLALIYVLPRAGFSFNIFSPERKMLRQSLRYGLPIMLASWLTWFSDHGIRFIVRYMLGMGAVGLLSAPWGLGRRAAAFTANLVNAAAFPLAVRRLREGARQDALDQLALNGALLFGLLAPTVAGVWAINEILARSLIDPRFQEMTIALLPMATLAGAIKNFRAHFPDQIFLLDGDTSVFIRIDLIEALAVLAFCTIGVWMAGLAGGVAGAAAGVGAGLAASMFFAAKAGGFHILWGHMARIALASLAMAGAIRLLAPSPTIGWLISSIILGAVIYALALAILHAGEIRQYLAARRRRHETDTRKTQAPA